MEYAIWILLGTLYGLLIGVIPIAGVTTALITVFSIAPVFLSDPYAGIIFSHQSLLPVPVLTVIPAYSRAYQEPAPQRPV